MNLRAELKAALTQTIQDLVNDWQEVYALEMKLGIPLTIPKTKIEIELARLKEITDSIPETEQPTTEHAPEAKWFEASGL